MFTELPVKGFINVALVTTFNPFLVTNLRDVLRVGRPLQESQSGKNTLCPDGESLMRQQNVVK